MDDSTMNGSQPIEPDPQSEAGETPAETPAETPEHDAPQTEGADALDQPSDAGDAATEPEEDEPEDRSSPEGNGHRAADQRQDDAVLEVHHNGHGAATETEQQETAVAVDDAPAPAAEEEDEEPVVAAPSDPSGLPSIDEMLAAFAARPREPEPDLEAATDEAGQIVAEGMGAEGEAAPVVDEWIPGDWFVVHTYSGYENKVKTSLEMRVHSMNMEAKIFEIVVPLEDVTEVKSGKKQVVQRKVFPGYLLVRMDLDDDSWYVVRNTPGVTGFVGSGTKPIPLSRREVDQILQRKTAEEKPKPRLEFNPGDGVRVVAGPFANFQGVISEIDTDRSKLKVLVNIFGRETPVELGFDQVAKL